MADDKEFDINLDEVLGAQDNDAKDMGFDDLLDSAEFDNRNADFINKAAVPETPAADNPIADDVAELNSGAPLEFASFDIEDFDAALNSFQAARAGKLAKSVPMPPPVVQPKPQPQKPVQPQTPVQPEVKAEKTPEVNTASIPAPQPEVEPEVKAAAPETPVKETALEAKPVQSKEERRSDNERQETPAPKTEVKNTSVPAKSSRSGFNPSTVDESDFVENTAERQQDILNWYSGELSDKTYQISPEKMPEFLDTDKTIRVLHVTVDSTYGWNVFFDNGVFMSLRDLKEYQERHGEIPCQDGKIIFGSKTTTFERILRVVVYERPRYFSYVVKS